MISNHSGRLSNGALTYNVTVAVATDVVVVVVVLVVAIYTVTVEKTVVPPWLLVMVVAVVCLAVVYMVNVWFPAAVYPRREEQKGVAVAQWDNFVCNLLLHSLAASAAALDTPHSRDREYSHFMMGLSRAQEVVRRWGLSWKEVCSQKRGVE